MNPCQELAHSKLPAMHPDIIHVNWVESVKIDG